MVGVVMWSGVLLWSTLPFAPALGAVGFASSAGLAFRARQARLLLLAVVGLVASLTSVVAPGMPWVLGLLLGFGVGMGALQMAGMSMPTWPRGAFGAPEALLTTACTTLAALALVAWWWWVDPTFDDLVGYIPAWQWPILLVGGLVFAMTNAALEEVLFRGLLLDVLRQDLALSTPAAIAVQAGVFGLLHLNGFPRGVSGVALATVYGVLMGLLRVRSGGLVAPWVGHVCINAGMFLTIAVLAWS
ncbi:MAG: CPBP family intramembrane glutamic endopeptidase [Myxococcota bacterium]